MKWVKTYWYYQYELEPHDLDFNANLGKNETNILAMVSSEPRTRRFSGNKVRRLTKPRFKLCIGGLGGYLYFKRLKDAKEFVEKTFEWMTEFEEIEV